MPDRNSDTERLSFSLGTPVHLELTHSAGTLVKLPGNFPLPQAFADDAAEADAETDEAGMDQKFSDHNAGDLEEIPEEASSKERGSKDQTMQKANLFNPGVKGGRSDTPSDGIESLNSPGDAKKNRSINRGKSFDVARVANILRKAL